MKSPDLLLLYYQKMFVRKRRRNKMSVLPLSLDNETLRFSVNIRVD